nr:cyclin-dependent kinase 1-like [Rhipicephalus microplus]
MDDYVVTEKIGKGTYGVVYKAKFKSTNEIVDIKKIRLRTKKTSGDRCASHDQPRGGLSQAAEMPQHSAACRRCHGGPKNKETLDGAVIKKYLSQIVDPILLFHQRRVLHRDLKPADLLIDGNGDNKVADFGLCHPFAEAVRLFTHNVGTL